VLRVEADDVDPIAVIYSPASGSSGEYSLAEIQWLTSPVGIAAMLQVRAALESRGILPVEATLDRASERLLRANQLLDEQCPETERAK
jgi:hypothetical protein